MAEVDLRRSSADLGRLREAQLDALTERARQASAELSRGANTGPAAVATVLLDVGELLGRVRGALHQLEARLKREECPADALNALGDLIDATLALDDSLDPASLTYKRAAVADKVSELNKAVNRLNDSISNESLFAPVKDEISRLGLALRALLSEVKSASQRYDEALKAAVDTGLGSSRTPYVTTVEATRLLDYSLRLLGADAFHGRSAAADISLGLRTDARRVGEALAAASAARVATPTFQCIGEDTEVALERMWTNAIVVFGCKTDQRWKGGSPVTARDGLLGQWMDRQLSAIADRDPARIWANPVRILLRDTLALLEDGDLVDAALRLLDTGPSSAPGLQALSATLDADTNRLQRAALTQILTLPIRSRRVSGALCPVSTLLTTVSA